MKRPLTSLVLAALLTLAWPGASWAPPARPDMSFEIGAGQLNAAFGRMRPQGGAGLHLPLVPVDPAALPEDCEFFGYVDCPDSDERIPIVLCENESGNVSLMPGGPPVPWIWRTRSAGFFVEPEGIVYRVRVAATVGTQTLPVLEAEAPVSVSFDDDAQLLHFDVSPLRLPIEYQHMGVPQRATTVLLGAAQVRMPLAAPALHLRGGEGRRSATMKLENVQTQLESGRVKVDFDVAFE